MSQNPFSQKVKIYTFSAIALTLIAVLLRICNFIFFFDTSVDYFQKNPFHTGFQILCILTVGWLLTSLLFIPRHSFSVKAMPAASFASRLTGLICACVSAASFFFFRENVTFYFHHAGLYNLLAIFSLLSTIYFGFQFIGGVSASYRVLAGYVTIVWLGLMLCATYLNLYVAMNSPFKITLHMALLGLMLHLLEDARLHTERGFRIAYLTYALIALFNCSIASLPVLIAFMLQRYHQADYIFYAALSLCFCAYLATRVCDCYRLLMVTPPSSAEEIAEEKKKREEKNKKKKISNTKGKGDEQHVS